MWGYPGKKLLFMGQEFAQAREWTEARALDWHQLDIAGASRACKDLVRDLNHLYRDTPALHARDCEGEGFEWLIADDAANSVFAWLRKAPGAQPGRGDLQLHAGAARAATACRCRTPGAGARSSTPTPASMAAAARATWAASRRATTGAASARTLTLPPLATILLEFEPGS